MEFYVCVGGDMNGIFILSPKDSTEDSLTKIFESGLDRVPKGLF